ncbi:PAS domain containing protein [Pseudanabaena biceps PCC 7429]|uniref:PAS domain containing protein n=2 Tax=Pseudanabaena TaxID=1152 RepID=L8N5E4_9CYAN|nr:PAS domain containing protein [Pseudanabaena biceps PCC 7429]
MGVGIIHQRSLLLKYFKLLFWTVIVTCKNLYPLNYQEFFMERPQSIAAILISDLPAVVADFQGLITDVNTHFEEFTGWRKEEIVGQLISVILPSYFRESHHMGFSRFTATGVATILNHPLELQVITKDNREILSEHYILAEKHDEKWFFGATLRSLES